MPLDTIPWMVAGGAIHTEITGRALAHAATKGKSGPTTATDLKVSALPTPGTSVRVSGGTASILNTYAGVVGQTYTARNSGDTNVGITATTGSARSDLLVLRIDDPQYGGSAPVDGAAVGPYAKFAIIPNVGGSATGVPAGTTYPCIPLARIDIPASTGTITNAMITDLRKPVDYEPVGESRNIVVVTNAQGRATINLAKTYPVEPVVTVTGGNSEVYWIVGVTKTSFTLEARTVHAPGELRVGNIRILYHASEPY